MSDIQFIDTERKVRKDHKCDLCHLQIPKGVKANYRSGIYDGDFYSTYSHSECEAIFLTGMRKAYGADFDDYELDLRNMGEYYPHTTYAEHQDYIRKKYNLI